MPQGFIEDFIFQKIWEYFSNVVHKALALRPNVYGLILASNVQALVSKATMTISRHHRQTQKPKTTAKVKLKVCRGQQYSNGWLNHSPCTFDKNCHSKNGVRRYLVPQR